MVLRIWSCLHHCCECGMTLRFCAKGKGQLNVGPCSLLVRSYNTDTELEQLVYGCWDRWCRFLLILLPTMETEKGNNSYVRVTCCKLCCKHANLGYMSPSGISWDASAASIAASLEELHSVSFKHQIENSYSTQLINSYLMITLRCPDWSTSGIRPRLVHCLQRDGARGPETTSSPLLANLFMEWLEKQAIATAPVECKPKLWKRYVDDATHKEGQSEEFDGPTPLTRQATSSLPIWRGE